MHDCTRIDAKGLETAKASGGNEVEAVYVQRGTFLHDYFVYSLTVAHAVSLVVKLVCIHTTSTCSLVRCICHRATYVDTIKCFQIMSRALCCLAITKTYMPINSIFNIQNIAVY